MSRYHTTLINHYGFSIKAVKHLTFTEAKKLCQAKQRLNQKHLSIPVPKPCTKDVHQVIKDTFKEQNALRYRKAKKDYYMNHPEFARGKGNKYCETYSRDKISGDIDRGSAVKMLKI